MNIGRMRSIPATREEFERNLFLMAERMKGGKFHIMSGLNHSIRGIERVRKLPNLRVDFLSVDESARLLANTMANVPTERSEAEKPESENDE